MTPEQKKIIKLGKSYLNPISPQDVQRLNEWIDRHLWNVLDAALKQSEELESLISQSASLIESGYRALDSVKHCQCKMTECEIILDARMRNTPPSNWTESDIKQCIDTSNRING